MLKQSVVSLIILCGMSACTETQYRPLTPEASEPSGPQDGLFGREVRFRLANAFYERAPDCVVIWPATGGQASALEVAIARHLSAKVKRVIGPKDRDAAARAHALDLRDSADRRRFADVCGCGFAIEVRGARNDQSYAVFWSQQSFRIDLELRAIKDGAILWRARHQANRSDGGLPLSPMAFAVNSAVAGAHHLDDDVSQSLVDDGLRRIFVTLPDLRSPHILN